MADGITIWTYDWVPEGPRGFVRDLRLRWACEEAGLSYAVRTVPFDARGPAHFARQPFGQVPFLDDGDLSLFESGAALLHLAAKSAALMPRDARARAEVTEWIIAALNSIEMVSVPWWVLKKSGEENETLGKWLEKRLTQLDAVLSKRAWLVAERFTAADIAMADVLRLPEIRDFGEHPAIADYLDRALERPSFKKAHADQLGHFERGDRHRAGIE
ncbi:MAG TPA: glutathione S-transferase family protein [Gammaproteobacteria bacterium]|nr:glutathione S-transferase family protein [Gammaproteobacteria bacterium]